MERPTRFEHHRFLGDKRNQRVYDLDTFTDEDVIAELMARRDLPLLRPRHPRRGPQPRLPPRSGPPRRRRRWSSRGTARGAALPVGREPPGRAPRPAADAGRRRRRPRRGAGPRLPERGERHRRGGVGAPGAGRPAGGGDGVAGHGPGLPRVRRVRGQLLARRVARGPRRRGQLPARQRAGHAACGWPASAPAARSRSARRPPIPQVRGVATLGAPADFDDWASHPKRLLEHAREVGIITDPTFPADVDAWTRELRELRAVACAPKVAPAPAARHPRQRRRPRPRVRRPRPRRRPRRRRAPHHERRRPPRPPRPAGRSPSSSAGSIGCQSSSLACGELLRAVGTAFGRAHCWSGPAEPAPPGWGAPAEPLPPTPPAGLALVGSSSLLSSLLARSARGLACRTGRRSCWRRRRGRRPGRRGRWRC